MWHSFCMKSTCSGGTVAIDMMLKLVENQYGRTLAQQISQQFQHDRIRTGIDSQQMADRIDLAMRAPKLIDVIHLMGSNIETPLTLPDIAGRCHLSLRQIERLFHKYRNMTPSQYNLSMRLSHANQLLLNTNRSVIMSLSLPVLRPGRILPPVTAGCSLVRRAVIAPR